MILFSRTITQACSRLSLGKQQSWLTRPRRAFFQKQSRTPDGASKARLQLSPTKPEQLADNSGSRALAKSFCFALGCSGAAFVGATIWQYENMRREAKTFLESRRNRMPQYRDTTKYGSFRHQVNSWWNGLSEGARVAYVIMAANLGVFLLWRVPRLQPTMVRYFSSNPASKSVCLPMLLSTFSHYSLLHLCANMLVLNSFAPAAVALWGKEQFVAAYLSAGVMSSFTSYLHKTLTRRPAMSLGASGAILAVIAAMCVQYPDAQLAIVFLPFFTFSAGMALKAVVALDVAGVFLKWQLLDHAAHLGGSLFGIVYILYGQEVWKRREVVMKAWHDIRYVKGE